LANQKIRLPSRRTFSRVVEQDHAYNKKAHDFDRLKTLYERGEYEEVITHAKIGLEKGISGTYRIVLDACTALKDEKTAERIVKIGLKRKINEIMLLTLLSNVYYATKNQTKYEATIKLVKELINKKEEILRRFTS
jgi:hypothetical protein